MTRLFALGLILCASRVHAAPREIEAWEPAKTWALVVGVVRWKDPSLEAFSAHHRKDTELMHALAERGVPEAQRTLLIDRQARRNLVLAALDLQVAAAPRGSTFIVYFEGHGVYDDDHRFVLATADTDMERLDRTGLPVDMLVAPLATRGRDDRVLLLADACFSGHLAAVASALTFLGVPTVALTSASEVSASSENWTFTQALIDGLRGRAIVDRDRDGTIRLSEVAEEARIAMRFREGQPIGWAPLGIGDLVLGPAAVWPADLAALDVRGDVFVRGDWIVAARLDGERGIARVLGAKREENRKTKLRVEFYDYTDRSIGWVTEQRADPVMFYSYPLGALVRVVEDEVEYAARVVRVEDGMHFVDFLDWAPGVLRAEDDQLPDDGFVTPDQLHGYLDPAEEAKHRVLVEDGGDLYEAVVKGRFNGEVCVRYPGSSFVEDDCVPEARVTPDTRGDHP